MQICGGGLTSVTDVPDKKKELSACSLVFLETHGQTCDYKLTH